MNTTTPAARPMRFAARCTVCGVAVLALLAGAGTATAAGPDPGVATPVHLAPVHLTAATSTLVAPVHRVDLQQVIDAGIAARDARDRANAAAAAVGAARGTADDQRAQLALAHGAAGAAQRDVDAQQGVVDAAQRAFLAAAADKNRAADATNAAPNDPVKEAEYNIRFQMFLDRLRELSDGGRHLDELKKSRDTANGTVLARTTDVENAEADLAAKVSAQTAADQAAADAEATYQRLSKDYQNGH